MRASTKLRAALSAFAFRQIDRLRGGPIQRNLAEIERLNTDPAMLATYGRERLRNLLTSAVSSTQFYAPYVGKGDLAEFPIINKRIVRERLEEFRSRDFDPSHLVPVTTSGSTGTPFTYYHGIEKRHRKFADLLYFNRLAGYSIGKRYALLRVTPKPVWRRFVQNEVWLPPRRMDESFFRKARSRLLNDRIEVVIGHSSVMGDLARYCESLGDTSEQYSLRGFVATSEVLTEQNRVDIERVFGCVVLGRYATEEFGILAHEFPGYPGYVINEASFHIELLALNEERPATQGEFARVVVTDYFSHPMPLIRFDTEDVVLLGPPLRPGGPFRLDRIEGKVMDDITDSLGRRVSPHTIPVALKRAQGIDQFQLHQLGPSEYRILIVASEPPRDDLVRSWLSPLLGSTAQISIMRLNEIPALPSGKRPIVRNLYNPLRTN